jgi:hypothetical protein
MEERTGAGAAGGGASAGGPGEQAGFDPQSAAAIVAEAAAHAERELTVRRQPIYLIWGLVYLVVYGAIWLSVRGQRPYQGPSGPVLGVVVAAVAIGAMVTAGVVQRAAGGVGGTSAGQRRIYLLAVVAGYIGVLTMEAAIDHAGASRAVIGIFGASAPLLVGAAVIIAGSATYRNRAALALGVWLAAVAAGSGFAGVPGVWAVDALAGGLPLLALAFWHLRRGHP